MLLMKLPFCEATDNDKNSWILIPSIEHCRNVVDRFVVIYL